MISGAHVHIETWSHGAELTRAINAVIDGGPFVLAAMEALGPLEHRCTFTAKQPGMALGYRNVIELQHRLSDQFDIVGVERVTTVDHLARVAS